MTNIGNEVADLGASHIDARTITALGERVAVVETEVRGLKVVVDKVSTNIHSINTELMKIQIGTGRNSDALDNIKMTVADRGVQIADFRASIATIIAEFKAEQATHIAQIATNVDALVEKRYLMEGAWGATVRISAAIVASIGVLGVIAKLLGMIR